MRFISCEIDQKGFLIKTQLCNKLCVILRSRVLRGAVYTLVKDTGRSLPS